MLYNIYRHKSPRNKLILNYELNSVTNEEYPSFHPKVPVKNNSFSQIILKNIQFWLEKHKNICYFIQKEIS